MLATSISACLEEFLGAFLPDFDSFEGMGSGDSSASSDAASYECSVYINNRFKIWRTPELTLVL